MRDGVTEALDTPLLVHQVGGVRRSRASMKRSSEADMAVLSFGFSGDGVRSVVGRWLNDLRVPGEPAEGLVVVTCSDNMLTARSKSVSRSKSRDRRTPVSKSVSVTTQRPSFCVQGEAGVVSCHLHTFKSSLLNEQSPPAPLFIVQESSLYDVVCRASTKGVVNAVHRFVFISGDVIASQVNWSTDVVRFFFKIPFLLVGYLQIVDK